MVMLFYPGIYPQDCDLVITDQKNQKTKIRNDRVHKENYASFRTVNFVTAYPDIWKYSRENWQAVEEMCVWVLQITSSRSGLVTEGTFMNFHPCVWAGFTQAVLCLSVHTREREKPATSVNVWASFNALMCFFLLQNTPSKTKRNRETETVRKRERERRTEKKSRRKRWRRKENISWWQRWRERTERWRSCRKVSSLSFVIHNSECLSRNGIPNHSNMSYV